MSYNNREARSRMCSGHTEHDRSHMELPKLDTTMQLTDAVETLGPLLEPFKAEQASREEKIQQLIKENKLLRERDTGAQHGQTSTKETELVNKIESLEKQLEQFKKERASNEQIFNRLSEENNSLKAQTKCAENQRSTSTSSSDVQLENARLTRLLDERNETLRNIEAAYNKEVDDKDAVRRKGNDLEKERDKFKRNMDTYKNAHEEERKKNVTNMIEIRDLKQQNEEYKINNQKIQQDKWKLEAELTESKKRLSRLMGSKLSDNNPDIADLSDMNRPTKLAEKYSELYDNQWTDAFEAVIENTDEITGINILLTLLQDMRGFCGGLADTQAKQLTKAALMTCQESNQLSQDFNKQLKDFIRATAGEVTDAVFQLYMAKVQSMDASLYQRVNHTQVKPFVQTCLQLCWFMSVQDPPVELGKRKTTALDTFDTTVYRPYTQTGAYFDYLVWPPLYLHENGPLLAKGVAQGRKLSTSNTTSNARPGSAIPVGYASFNQTPSQVMERSYRPPPRTDTTKFSRTITGSSGIYDNVFPSTMQNMPSTEQTALATPMTTDQRGILNDLPFHKATSGVQNTSAFQNPPSEPENMWFFNYYVRQNGQEYAKEQLGEEDYYKCVRYSEYQRATQERLTK